MSVNKCIFFFTMITVISCEEKIDYYHLPSMSSNNLINAVIEIPAGTNKKYEYNASSKTFEIDQKNGENRIVQFLPYPGNYGYIPSTFSDPEKGGDGDALDVLVLSESMPTGTVLEITAIAVLKLIDEGELDHKIIAIPADNTLQLIRSKTYVDFEKHYPEVKQIIELWFLNYNKDDKSELEGWGDEMEAIREINSSRKL